MKTLVINAAPFTGEDSLTRQLATYLKTVLPANSTYLDLYQEDIPALDNQGMALLFKQQKGEQLSPDEKRLADKRSALLAEFKAHKRIVIIYPMFNYNIPAKLKDYLDNVLIPRETFRYSEDGKLTGLLNDGREVLFIQSSGSCFSGESEFAKLEFAYRYLDAMFYQLGFEKRALVRAEGSALLPKTQVLEKAKSEIAQLLSAF